MSGKNDLYSLEIKANTSNLLRKVEGL